MTRISSYSLLQCTSCGQKHILPNYGSINFMLGNPPVIPGPGEIRVCQSCSVKKPLREFINLGILTNLSKDSSPKWLRFIRRKFKRSYREPDLHPLQLYPDLNSTQFDAETYFPELAREYMAKTNTYPKWYLELKSRTK